MGLSLSFIIIVLLSRFLYCCLVLGLATGLLESFCFTFSCEHFLYIWTSERCLSAVLTFSRKQIAVAFDSGPDSLMGEMFLTSIRQALCPLYLEWGFFSDPVLSPGLEYLSLFPEKGIFPFSFPVIPTDLHMCPGNCRLDCPSSIVS